MKRLVLLVVTLISFSASAQRVITKKFKLPNKTEKLLKIFLPKGIENDTVHRYPLTIVLDDDYLFDMTIGTAKIYADADLAPRQLVVGIPTNRDENKDVSIIKESQGLTKNSTALYNFIKDDLIKYMRAKYKASAFKTIIGDRKAANYALYFIDEREPIFNSYICLDPKFDEAGIKKIESYNLNKLKGEENIYYLYVSSSPFLSEKELTQHKKLESILTSFNAKNINTKFDNNEDAINGVTNVCTGISKGLAYCFNRYRCITKKEFKESIKDLAPLDAIKYLEQKYIDINFIYDTNTNIRLKDFYAIENIVIDKEEGDHLTVLGDLALIKHEKLPLGDYYMGMYYEKGKEYNTALDYYKVGYGKMDPSDPKGDEYYLNIYRVQNLMGKLPKEKANDNSEDKDDEDEDDEENSNENK